MSWQSPQPSDGSGNAQQPAQPNAYPPPQGYYPPPQPPQGYYPPQQPYPYQQPQPTYPPEQPFPYQQPLQQQGFYPGPPPPRPPRSLARNPFIWLVGVVVVVAIVVGVILALPKSNTPGVTPTVASSTATISNTTAAGSTALISKPGTPDATATFFSNVLTQRANGQQTSVPNPDSTPTILTRLDNPTSTIAPTATKNATIAARATTTAKAVAAVQTTAANAVRQATANANATASSASKAANQATQGAAAKATADRNDFLNWAKSHAPQGNFSVLDKNAGVGCTIEYRDHIGDMYADDQSKFIVFTVVVENFSSKTMTVNPYDFTMVTVGGYAASVDDNTFLLDDALKDTTLPAGSHTNGTIAFLLTKDSVPRSLVFNNSETELTVEIVKP